MRRLAHRAQALLGEYPLTFLGVAIGVALAVVLWTRQDSTNREVEKIKERVVVVERGQRATEKSVKRLSGKAARRAVQVDQRAQRKARAHRHARSAPSTPQSAPKRAPSRPAPHATTSAPSAPSSRPAREPASGTHVEAKSDGSATVTTPSVTATTPVGSVTVPSVTVTTPQLPPLP